MHQLSAPVSDIQDGFDHIVHIVIIHLWRHWQGDHPLVLAIDDRGVIGSVAVLVAIIGVDVNGNANIVAQYDHIKSPSALH
jgi:hypothetical protein